MAGGLGQAGLDRVYDLRVFVDGHHMPRVVELRVHDAFIVIYIGEGYSNTDHNYEYVLTILHAATRSADIVVSACRVEGRCIGSESGEIILKVDIDNRARDWSDDWGHYILREDINR